MIAASPAAIASRYGAMSFFMISATERPSRGTSTWESSGAARRLARRAALAVPPPTELAHRGDRGKAVAKPLYAPAFVVDADRQRRLAQALDVPGERA